MQLPTDIVTHDFDIGIENGGGVLSLWTGVDLAELWSDLKEKGLSNLV